MDSTSTDTPANTLTNSPLTRFLSVIAKYNKNSIFTWQAIADLPDLPILTYEFISYNSPDGTDNVIKRMNAANAKGYCISIAPNEFNYSSGKGRTAANVVDVNTLIVDVDVPISPQQVREIKAQLNPHIIVVTSAHGTEEEPTFKLHLYFLLKKAKSPKFKQWLITNHKACQQRLARGVDSIVGHEVSDKSITIEKAMRCPGFTNWKYGAPQDTELVYIDEDESNYLTEKDFSSYQQFIESGGKVPAKAPTTKKPTLELVPSPSNAPESPSPNPLKTTYTPTEEGNRHNNMLSYIANILRTNIPIQEVVQLTLQANELNNPPLEEQELARIFSDCVKYWEEDPANPANVKAMLSDPTEIASAIEQKQAIIEQEAALFKYDYSDKRQFIDVVSDKAILYRLYQKDKDRIKGSQYLENRVYNPSTGTFETDEGDIDNTINDIIVNMAYEPAVIKHFSRPAKKSEEDTVQEDELVLDKRALTTYIINARSVGKCRALTNMVSYMKEFATRPDLFDSNDYLLNAQNGVIDLSAKGKLVKHEAKYMFSKRLATTYNPNKIAAYTDLDTKEKWLTKNIWTKFIYEVMDGDIDMAVFLQTLLGYSLQGSLDAHIIGFFYGLGCNGKSVCLEAILKMLGTYGRSVTNNLFIDNNNKSENAHMSELAQLCGARFVLADEIQDGVKLNEAAVKNVTTGAEIVARFLHKNPFTYRPQFTSFLHGNHKPIITGNDAGIWRRMVLVPFEVSFLGRVDRDLPKKLAQPEILEDMLAWCVAGNLRYSANGLSIPSKCLAAKKAYQADMNHVLGFIDSCLLIDNDGQEYRTNISLVYGVYKYWCVENNIEPITKIVFGKKLHEAGIGTVRVDRNTRAYTVELNAIWKQVVDSVGEGNMLKDNVRQLFG